MDRHASEILESEELLHLSADALIKLIKRNSFCASEMVIFRAVSAWCQYNNVKKELIILKIFDLHTL